MNLENYYKWFENYVEMQMSTQDREKFNYELKLEHTYRVRDNIVKLGKEVGLSAEKLYLSELIGLFHDLGRFKQYTDYNSFSDSISGSHGELSVKVLEEYGVLKDLECDSAEKIKKAIIYHNYLLVPENEDEEIKQLSYLIRDADKLDAFFLETNKDEKRSYTFDALSEEQEYSNLVINDLQNGRQVDFRNFKYKYDRKLGVLGLIFDLKYDESFELIQENNYIQMMFEILPKDETMKRLKQFIFEYLAEKCIKK